MTRRGSSIRNIGVLVTVIGLGETGQEEEVGRDEGKVGEEIQDQ